MPAQQQQQQQQNSIDMTNGNKAMPLGIESSDDDMSTATSSTSTCTTAPQRNKDYYHGYDPKNLEEDHYLADADSLLAKELNQMSMQERDLIFSDVHGVAALIPEDPTIIAEKLQQLQKEIDSIYSKSAYNLAKAQSIDYVTDSQFLLKFLRADQFNSKQAAKRVVSYFDWKKELFGTHLLTKEITLDDLEPSDVDCILKGYMQVLPCRDQGGRAVLISIPALRVSCSRVNALKVLWYLCCSTAEDEENQRRGVVFLGYNVGPDRTNDPTLVRKIGSLRNGLPIRAASVHNCFDDPLLRILGALAMMVMDTETRARFRNHTGTPRECLITLQQFGIPKKILPINEDGTYDLENHKIWFEQRRQIEAARQKEMKQMKHNSCCHSFQQYNISDDEDMSMAVTEGSDEELQSQASMETHETNAFNKKQQQQEKEQQHLHSPVPQEAYSSLESASAAATAASRATTAPALTATTTTATSAAKSCSSKSNARRKTSTNTCTNKKNTAPITLPGYYDVLFGRGKTIVKHPGNLRFHQILNMYQARYELSTKNEREKVVDEILSIVNSSGRFLKKKKDQNLWEEVEVTTARDKISQTYRTRRAVANKLLDANNGNCNNIPGTINPLLQQQQQHALVNPNLPTPIGGVSNMMLPQIGIQPLPQTQENFEMGGACPIPPTATSSSSVFDDVKRLKLG